MSVAGINSLLGNQMGSLTNLATAATKTTESLREIMDRKHYSGGGGGGGHHGQSKKKGHSIALSALTLLAFLFFLNILQQCLQEQMDMMNPQVIVMQARIQAAREAEAKEKEAEKRIGETVEGERTTVSSIPDKEDEIPSFSKAESLYHYDKVHVPVRLKSIDKGRL